jgi:hypothetical protein
MRPRNHEDGKRRLNFPRRDQRAFWLLPQTAGVPHPARPCPFQSPKRALVAAPPCFRLDLRRGVPLRIPPLTPCSIAPLHSPRRKSRPMHRFSAHSGPSVHSDNFPPKGARSLAIHTS